MNKGTESEIEYSLMLKRKKAFKRRAEINSIRDCARASARGVTMEIEIEPFKRAAQEASMPISEKPYILKETEVFTVSIVQTIDEFVLRVSSLSADISVDSIYVAGQKKEMIAKKDGDYELFLGKTEQMPGHIEIIISVNGKEFFLEPRFKKR